MPPPRLDLSLLDPDDPFEIDSINAPHLAKHQGCDPDLLYSMWDGDRRFFPADHGPAHWFLVADVAGTVYQAPLAPPSHSGPDKCRPIGIYEASDPLIDRYYASL